MTRHLLLAAMAAFLFANPYIAFAAEYEGQSPDQVLVAGPMLAHSSGMADHESADEVDYIPELNARTLWPRSGGSFNWAPGDNQSWRLGDMRAVDELPENRNGAMVTWFATYAHVDRFGEVAIRVTGRGELRVFVDGEDVGSAGSMGQADTSVSVTKNWARGCHRILIRAQSLNRAPDAHLSATPSGSQQLSFSTDPSHTIAIYDELRRVVGLSGLLLSPDGLVLTVRTTRRDPIGIGTSHQMDLLDTQSGRVIAAAIGGDSASAVSWSPSGRQLLLRDGDDLSVWNRANGRVTTILKGETGLGSVVWSPDESFLVFSSSKGVTSKANQGPQRRLNLREKLSDWPTDPHLHMIMLDGSVRRRLMVPGDWMQDSFAVLPDNRNIVYLRSVPTDSRPWFDTEVWKLDLTNDSETRVASLTMGFENRPGLSGMELSPDGRRIAFVGPPSELGEKADAEPNAFDSDLFVMKLSDGSWYRVTENLDSSVDGKLHWSKDSNRVFFQATDGSLSRIYEATLGESNGSEEAVQMRVLAHTGEVLSALSLAADGTAYAYVSSQAHTLPRLYVHSNEVSTARVLMDPNSQLENEWLLSKPLAQDFKGPDGSTIEAWLYRPQKDPAKGEKLPLIVYYYGGASPTLRGLNELHQFFIANGYAVYVLNPRGAAGYGEKFAAQHVAEWGERAGMDILAGLDHVLASNPDLDPERVGCYGGSYGGFMTMWLISHSDKFSAACELYGISNIASYFGHGEWGWTYGDQALAKTFPWNKPKWYTEHSPLFHADKIHTPLLLLHGDADGNVPITESEQMFTALKLLGREAELVVFPGEDHGLRGTWKSRVDHRTMMLDWFDKHLRQQPKAWAMRWK